MVEHMIWDHGVVGSSPTAWTIFIIGNGGIKMFVVKDCRQKIRTTCKTRDDISSAIVLFASLFETREEDLKIKNCETGEEMTYREFMTK